MVKVKMDSNEVDLLIRNYNLTMRCLPSGTGLQYKWSRRNGSVPASAVGVDTSTLTIFRLTPEDAGDYQCILSNISGLIASQFDTLKVTGMDAHVYIHCTLCLDIYTCMCQKGLMHIAGFKIYFCPLLNG